MKKPCQQLQWITEWHTNFNALFLLRCSQKSANPLPTSTRTNSPKFRPPPPHGRNRSTSSVKLDPIHKKERSSKKKRKSAEQAQQPLPASEDTDEGFCSNGSCNSSSTSQILLPNPKVVLTAATPIPPSDEEEIPGTPESEVPTYSEAMASELSKEVKELLHDVLMDVRLDLTDEGIELD